ncbi:MAG: hypothetical protein E7409_01640 [Ruminococcaceae bacterium]|nr:hypothetical protein [Oscillospiraceae bacterium]
MKKIGFIDYYLDEWHANEYPAMIREQSGGRYEVCYAYGHIDSPIGGITNKEWAKKHGVELLDSIEEVIEKSDVLVVLSPDNPEMHEELTDLPLKSGKLTYVDKTFAPDREAAKRIFANADANGTACYSTSALRFASELDTIDKAKIQKIYSEGPGTYEMYSIHQIEPIIKLMGCRVKRVMGLGDLSHPSLIIEFEDGRYAQLYQGEELDFCITVVDGENKASKYPIESDFFGAFIANMLAFFDTGEIPVPHEQTVDVISVRETGIKALKTPYRWLDV